MTDAKTFFSEIIISTYNNIQIYVVYIMLYFTLKTAINLSLEFV